MLPDKVAEEYKRYSEMQRGRRKRTIYFLSIILNLQAFKEQRASYVFIREKKMPAQLGFFTIYRIYKAPVYKYSSEGGNPEPSL